MSGPLASSLAAFVVPAAQAVHALEDTYSFAAHALASHDVSGPLASSLAAFVVPAAQAVHALEDTYSFAAHALASHDVSGPLASSLAAFVVPAAQAVHALEDTYSFAAHSVGGGGLGGGDGIRYHALGGPSVDDEPSERAYDASHADATLNIAIHVRHRARVPP